MEKQGYRRGVGVFMTLSLCVLGLCCSRAAAEEAAPSVDTVVIALQTQPEKGGSVSGGGRYVAGDTAKLTARPAQDWHFVAWMQESVSVSEEATFRLPVTEAMAAIDTLRYTATFEHDPLAVTLRTHLTEAEAITMNGLYAYRLEAGARVNDEDDRIADIAVFINDTPVEAQFDSLTSSVRAWYTPKAFGETAAVRFEARSRKGLTAALQRQLKVEQGDTAAPNRTVRTMDKVLINFPEPGQTNGGVYTLPQYVGHYESIIAHLDVTCPTLEEGGQPDCDDWDRVGWIEVQTPDGQWREIIRYITSYRKPCSHTIDVTEFASYLQGEVPMRMYIETWGTGGWEITLDLEYVSGPSQFLYSELVPLWNGVFPFGDPARLQPLDTVSATIPDDVAAMSLRIVTTGHGWGGNNTGNAAEFYEATHKVLVNDTAISQNLWMKCNPNPDGCQPQNGTWRYNRAGWCPGVIAPGYHYNLSGHMADGQVEVAYVFDEKYVDLCHPNNPDCVSGKTCTDCNDTYNPMYYIASYLVYWYNRMYEGDFPPGGRRDTTGIEKRRDVRNLTLQTWPNPTADEFYVRSEREIGAGVAQVIDAQGKVYMQRRFTSAEDLAQRPFSLAGLPAGTYVVRLLASDWYMGAAVIVKQ
ncbi:MAG: hypothetical protein K2O53_08640 [Bacteroidales bacterium]|nr:hypothetical protein [Bacteroidales bacterium]